MAEIVLGGERYTVSPLSFSAMRKTGALAEKLDAIRAEPATVKQMGDMLDIALDLVLLWIKPPDPKAMRTHLDDRMTLEDLMAMPATIGAVMTGSGIKLQGEPKAQAAEEPVAAKRRSRSRPSSTASSPNSSRRAAKAAPGI